MDLLAPQQADQQKLRIRIVALLRASRLAENMKQALMIMLPSLPLERLQRISAQLTKEAELRSGTGKTMTEVKAELYKIKRSAWKAAERESTPDEATLNQQLFSQMNNS